MKRRRFKLARRIMLFLLLGAIINVAVAWTIGLFGSHLSGFADKSIVGVVVDEIKGRSPGSSSRFIFDAGSGTRGLLIDERGLPMHSLGSETRIQFDGPAPVEIHSFAIVLEPSRYLSPTLFFPKVLSLRPLWPGFAINTIFYAAMLWMLFAAPRALSRKRRLMRGLCPVCAYPVGSSDVCTECGNKVHLARRMVC